MTLNTQELARTRAELTTNLALTGLTTDQVLADLGWIPGRLAAVLDGTGSADPVDVWELRDYLVQAVKDGGGTPAPFSTLTGVNKIRARMWFSLRKAPRHDFAGV